jgi:hypothetical protein
MVWESDSQAGERIKGGNELRIENEYASRSLGIRKNEFTNEGFFLSDYKSVADFFHWQVCNFHIPFRVFASFAYSYPETSGRIFAEFGIRSLRFQYIREHI